jgi:hypothetical protein
MGNTPFPPLATGTEAISADDFKRIKGIGPAVERRLHDAGIFTFTQLAALTPLDIAALVSNLTDLSAERITQQDWVGRACQLAAKPAEPQPNPIPVEDGQHYSTFSVELLLDDAVEVRRTRIKHIQDGAEDAWTGWEEARLMNFVARYAPLRLQSPAPHPPMSVPEQVAPAPQPRVRTNLMTQPGRGTLAAAPFEADGPPNLLQQDQPFELHLALDLTEVDTSGEESLNYTAIVYAKRLGGSLRQTIAEAGGATAATDTLTINMIGALLSAGMYRLEAAVTLTLLPTQSDIKVFLEGSLLQIY